MCTSANPRTERREVEDDPSVLLEAVERLLCRGDVDEALWLLRSIRRRIEPPTAEPRTLPGLTRREAATLALLPDASLSQKDMAQALGISLNTLKTHLRSLYQKLGVHSRGEAIEHVWVREHGDTIDSARLLVAV